MIDALVAGLRANDCTVEGPMSYDDARAAVAARTEGLVAWNDDVPFAPPAGALTPDDPSWSARLRDAAVGVTIARFAVAQPSALVLAAGPGAPRATSLVPTAHLCVLRASDIVPSMTAALERIGSEPLPSALTWIGGPSRTGDLEMIITLGVHGPRTVDVILLDA